MSDPLDKKGLEDFFHQHLDQYEDEPAADFWDQLEPQIPEPPQKKRRGLLLWWLFGAAAFVLLMGYVVYNQRQVEQLENAIIAQQELMDAFRENPLTSSTQTTPPSTTQKAIKTAPPTGDNEPANTMVEDTNTDVEITPPSETLSSNSRGELIAKAATNKRATTTALPPITVSEVPEEPNSKPQPITNRTQNPEVPQPNAINNTLIPTLASKTIFAERRTLENEATTISTIGFTPLFKLGVYYEQWLWARGTGPQTSEENFSANGQGLNIALHLGPHWQISSGVGRLHLQSASRGESTLAYDANGATLVDDKLVNDYRYDFSSPLGVTEYNSSIGFSILNDPSLALQDGDNFAISIREVVKANYLRLPLEASYHSAGKKWEWMMGLGVDYYQLVQLRVNGEISNNEVNNAENTVFARNNSAVFLLGLQNSFWSARINTGLTWRGKERWQIGLHAFGQHSIGEFSVNRALQGAGLQLRAAYGF